MSGSTIGTIFRVTTFGESHGPAVGAVIDGCPAGLSLTAEKIQPFLDRRRPGNSRFQSARDEADRVEILSGVYDCTTTGTPIALLIRNSDARPEDYEEIADIFRPGHADFTYEAKYGIRDHRGGGRASGRETAARVAAGAVASLLLSEHGIKIRAYAKAIGPVCCPEIDLSETEKNELRMPDARSASEAIAYLKACADEGDSVGGLIECVASGVPAGLGEPVFDKLDAELAKAVFSIGAVKGVEIGDGFAAARARGSKNNDIFLPDGDGIKCATNHAGGILGGISTGSDIILRAAVKPAPSIAKAQRTAKKDGSMTDLSVGGRHDPCIVPRVVPVVEAMTAIVLADAFLKSKTNKLGL